MTLHAHPDHNSTLCRWLVAIALLFAVAPVTAEAQPAIGVRPPQGGADGTPASRRTANYEVFAEDGQELADQVAQYMEQLHAAYTQRIGRIRPSTRRLPPMKVIIAATPQSFEKLVGPDHANTGGIYDEARQRIVARSDGPLEKTLRVLRHEGCHQFVCNYIRRDMPVWISEGLAVLFEEADLCGTSLQTGDAPPQRVAMLQKALADAKLHRLPEILQMDQTRWSAIVRDDLDQGRLLYSEVWSLVHFLVEAEDGAYRPALNKYLAALAQGQNAAAAQREAFGDLDRFEQKWREYVKVLRPSSAALCRRNMKVIADLLPMIWTELPPKPTATQFFDHLLARPQGAVLVVDPQLGRISTREPETVRALMRCPHDSAVGGATSYRFVYAAAAGDTSANDPAAMAAALPEIHCPHHGRQSHRLIFLYDPRLKSLKHEIRLQQLGE